MANFEPKWNLVADANSIQEGQSTYFKLQISKNQDSDVNNSYTIDSNQYIELTFTISGSGETLENRDFIISIGENSSSLVELSAANTGTTEILATHVIKFTATEYDLSSTSFINAFFFNIVCPQDGIWDGPESLTFNIDSINLITTTNNEITSTNTSGILGISTQILNYNTINEIWLTPDLITHGTTKYAIGEISYGAESRLFVQAFGFSSNESGLSTVFMPAYKILTIDETEIPSEHITGSGTILIPDLSNGYIEEIPLLVKDISGNLVSTGLKFNGNNGQIVQTMLYDSDPIDAYFKVEIVSVKSYYTTEADAYYTNKRFRAYQTWIAPSDVSDFYDVPTPSHLYQLKDTSSYPYVIKEITHDGNVVMSYDSSKWYDLGIYDETLATTILNKTRIFRIVLNNSSGTDLSFETDSNLGEIHVGEYFGHTVYPKISATGSDLITYSIDYDTSPNDIRKYNLDLSADGYMIGTAYAKSSDFTANDDIPLQFDIVATAKTGSALKQRFSLRIIRGLGQNTISANICPSLSFERSWYSMISTNSYSNSIYYYRESDPRYGLRKIPRILLKENYVNSNNTWPGIETVAKNIKNHIIDITNGAPVPESTFKVVLGNFKVRSALDSSGNVLYDLLYREIHPVGTMVELSLNPLKYQDYTVDIITEIYGLRHNIFKIVGEDTTNLLTDPTDLNARGIVVDAITGLSDEMIDTVPRFMNHPYIEDTIQAMYFPCLPVAYLQAGTGETFFNTLVQNNEHSKLLNTEFEISSVELYYFVNNFSKYVQEKFVAGLRVANLFQ